MNEDTEAYIAICRLQRAYADISTRHAWDEMELLATPDAIFSFHTQNGVFEVTGGAAFAELGPRMSGQFSFHLLIPINFVVAIGDDGRARGRSWLLEVNEERESGKWNEVYGTYHDDYKLDSGRWLFSRREYRPFGRRSAGQLEAFPLEDRPL
jgi:SnoaL-like domain